MWRSGLLPHGWLKEPPMSQEISESEWKILRELKPIALDRFCQRVLAEVDRITTDTAKGRTSATWRFSN